MNPYERSSNQGDALACWYNSLDDKDRAPECMERTLNKFFESFGYRVTLSRAKPTLTEDIVAKAKELMMDVAWEFDLAARTRKASDRDCRRKEPSRLATKISKGLIIFRLSGYISIDGRPLSRNALFKALGWRRDSDHRFFTESDITSYPDDSLEFEINPLIRNAYREITEKL